MDKLFEDYLFQKQILVRRDGEEEQHVFETLYALANLFNVSIGKNKAFAQNWMIAYVSERLGEDVPQPFYVGFPESVRALSTDQRLFDQMVHYARTYGFGDFSNPGHSILEEQFERTAFKEKTEVKVFEIMKEADAVKLLAQLADGRWGGIEIKLGGDDLIDDGAKSLKTLRDKIVEKSDEKAPSFLLVLTAVGGAYRREDGVYVVPINLLKP